RVRAVLRRYALAKVLPARDEKRRAYRFAGWELNLRSRRLTSPKGKRIGLTNGEFMLLQAFCAAPRRILARDQLLVGPSGDGPGRPRLRFARRPQRMDQFVRRRSTMHSGSLCLLGTQH